MTTADHFAFDQAFRKVVRVHGLRDWTETAIVRIRGDYFDALQDLPIDALQRAADALVRSAQRWPKPADWRSMAGRTHAPKPYLATPGLETYACLRCEDTGWRPACGCDISRLNVGKCEIHGPTLEPQDTSVLLRKPTHRNKAPHYAGNGTPTRQRFVSCECRSSNPVWQAHRPRAVSEEKTS